MACGGPGDLHIVRDINGTGLDLGFVTVVPANGEATFWQGCRHDLNGAQWSCADDELEQHRVTFGYGFELMRTEVTVDQYRACVLAGHPGCVPAEECDFGDSNYRTPGALDQPVVCVSWQMARAFSEWIGGRLPSESEWEYGARGPMDSPADYSVFPWGDDEIDCDLANHFGCGGLDDVGSRSPQGDSAFGLADMAGNVREWTEDVYGSYDDAPVNGDARGGAGDYRVGRGGSWFNTARLCRAASRFWYGPGYRFDDLGFRPARSVNP